MIRPAIFSLIILSLIFPNANVVAQIQWQPHPLQLDVDLNQRVKFGYLAVPESRDKLNSREIFMAFTVVRSYSDHPLPDPVICIPGGPGDGTSEYVQLIAQREVFQKILQNRDLVLVDPRGCGYSYPAICENLNSTEFRLKSAFSRGAELDFLLENAVKECTEIIAASGADVSAYNSVEVAHDLEALRKELEYEKWNIRGHSYGSRYGMTLLQQYPHSVRSAVLSGMVPLKRYYNSTPVNLSRSLRLLFENCEADPECSQAFPELRTDLSQLLKRLDNDPIPIPVYVSKNNSEEKYFITSEKLFDGLFSLLYFKNGIEIAPLMIHHLARGNDWIAQSMAMPLVNQLSVSRMDANLIIECNDDKPDPEFLSSLVADELTTLVGEYVKSSESKGLKKYWPVIRGTEQLPLEIWNQSDVPVILISGEFDPITPPEYGNAVSVYFTNSVHHVISGSGHAPHSDARIDYSPFYNNPDPNFDITSHMEVKPLQFVTKVTLNRGLSESAALLGAGSYQRFIFPAVAIVLCLFGWLFFPFRAIFRKIHKKGSEGLFMEIFTIWMVTFLTLVIVALFYLAIMDTVATNPYILAVGLPAKWSFIRILAIVLLFTLITGILIVRKIWSSALMIKIPSIISILGGLVFTLYIWINGLV